MRAFSFVPGAVCELVGLGQWQRIHVCAQADPLAFTVADHADQAGLAESTVHFDTPFGQLGGDQVGGALLFETEFGVGMNVTSQCLDLCLGGEDFWDQLHGWRSCSGVEVRFNVR